MKKVVGVISGALALAIAAGMTACDGEKNIMVITRTAGSGTRAAFEELVKKNDVKLQEATLTSDLEEAKDTGVVVSKVATTRNAIGYISLASLSDSVKALSLGGVAPTVENVQSGEYKLTRPFILMTPNDNEAENYGLSELAFDFFNFCMSESGKTQIEAEGCVAADRSYETYNATANLAGTVKIEGSSSMEDLMGLMIGEYAKLQPNVTVTYTNSGSSGGRSAVQNDSAGNTIGLASSSKVSANYEEHTLCIDAIAVIVNPQNTLHTITVEQLFDIYTGAITKFSEITE